MFTDSNISFNLTESSVRAFVLHAVPISSSLNRMRITVFVFAFFTSLGCQILIKKTE
jgi:hypothetical protein